jgi:hypothetical protein
MSFRRTISPTSENGNDRGLMDAMKNYGIISHPAMMETSPEFSRKAPFFYFGDYSFRKRKRNCSL